MYNTKKITYRILSTISWYAYLSNAPKCFKELSWKLPHSDLITLDRCQYEKVLKLELIWLFCQILWRVMSNYLGLEII